MGKYRQALIVNLFVSRVDIPCHGLYNSLIVPGSVMPGNHHGKRENIRRENI
jgi:hypothetical protein